MALSESPGLKSSRVDPYMSYPRDSFGQDGVVYKMLRYLFENAKKVDKATAGVTVAVCQWIIQGQRTIE